MKKLILSCCLLSSLNCIFAQTPAYLDIKVSESIEQQPTSMEYHLRVNLGNNEEYDLDRDYEAQRKVMRSRIRENETQLKQFLDNNKVKYSLNREESYVISQDEIPFSIFKVKISNKTELDNLVTLLRQVPYIEGNVGDKTYPSSENDELGLFEKLYKKARAKAEKMAALMNCSLGKVLEAEDLHEKNMDYYDIVSDAGYEPLALNGGARDPLSTLTTLSMRFRFELIQK